jgi:hypothetical protein
MKKLITIALCLACSTGYAQKYMTRTGKITFDATTPHSPEKIEGINNEVASIVDEKTGDIVFQVPIKSFKFEKQLMEEHFNENYMESDKYSKSEFKGKIANISEINFSKDGTYEAKVAGKLTIHGVTNEVNIPGKAIVKENKLTLKTKFVVKLADYKISVPSMVADKLSKEATVTMDSELTKK